MTAEVLLSKLQKVRDRGPGKWTACCPAHDDRGPSLSVKESTDGTVLLHCFAGCSVYEVLAAVGLEVTDLFPPSDQVRHTARRFGFTPSDALTCLAIEANVLAVIACDLADGHALTDVDRDRLLTAGRRINEARKLCGA